MFLFLYIYKFKIKEKENQFDKKIKKISTKEGKKNGPQNF